ncbi:hypothetical protein ACW9IK_07250 [Pseudomonas gingeri]
MNINTHVGNLLSDEPNTYTPSWLEIPITLTAELMKIISASENEVKEKGTNLLWQNDQITLEHTSPTQVTVYTGQHDSVKLNSEKLYTTDHYIGNFHNHPYREKYASLAAVGPSSGDWDQWVKFFPNNKNCSVRLVSSNTELFVIIFRKPCPTLVTGKKISDETTRQTNILWDTDQYKKEYMTHFMEEKFSEAGKTLHEHFPNAAIFHAEDVESMNIEQALLNNCEYYRGKLKENSPTYVYLKSQRILGNWLTARIWTKASEPWPWENIRLFKTKNG